MLIKIIIFVVIIILLLGLIRALFFRSNDDFFQSLFFLDIIEAIIDGFGDSFDDVDWD